MKQTLPLRRLTALKFASVLIIFFTFFACEKEDFDLKENSDIAEEIIIKTHNSIDYNFDEELITKLQETKSLLTVREKSFYDSLNHFYVDDSRFNHLKSGNYESYTFAIVDTKDTTLNKQLVIATKLNEQNEVFYESYLATFPKVKGLFSTIEGELISNSVRLKKIQTSFLIPKELVYESSGSCMYVWNVETEEPPCANDHSHDEPTDPDDDHPVCALTSTTTRTLLAADCNAAAGGNSSSSYGDGSTPDNSGPNTSGPGGPSGTANYDPDGNTPFSPIDGCGDSIGFGDGSGGCNDGSEPPLDFGDLMIEVFLDQLDTTSRSWLNSRDQTHFRLELEAFLKSDLGNFDQNLRFANEAIRESIEGRRNVKVDFENKSIYDASVPECLRDVIDKFKPTEGFNVNFNNLQSQLATQLSMPNLILDLFDNNQNYGLKFVVDNIPNNSRNEPVNANTIPSDSQDGGRMVTITLNSDYVNRATDLALARTVIHELMHAYFIYELETNPTGTIGTAIDEIIQDAGVTRLTSEHELMAQQFVTIMANSLEQWNGSVQDRTEYERLAWSGGMKDSDIFKNMDPNEQTVINFRDQIESDPTDPDNFALGDPLGIKNC